jgi:hypothetical protein
MASTVSMDRRAAEAPCRVASIRSDVLTPLRRPTFRSSAAKAGALCATQPRHRRQPAAGLHVALPQVEQVALRLRLARQPQIAGEMVTPRNGSAPWTSVCARTISPYSSGKTSSDARNSRRAG